MGGKRFAAGRTDSAVRDHRHSQSNTQFIPPLRDPQTPESAFERGLAQVKLLKQLGFAHEIARSRRAVELNIQYYNRVRSKQRYHAAIPPLFIRYVPTFD